MQWRERVILSLGVLCASVLQASGQTFISRSGDRLMEGSHPFTFLGGNAYFLPSRLAFGDTSTVETALNTAAGLGMSVIRTWAFFDSPDSLNPAVMQSAPGHYREQALAALDDLLARARRHGIRLLLVLVNNWDEFGGMNQYVRWRMGRNASAALAAEQSSGDLVIGQGGRSYLRRTPEGGEHDDFYRDPVIRSWYLEYARMLLERMNGRTGVRYRDDPWILGWELANEPRSSDRSGRLVSSWVEECAQALKVMDANHLIGTGEEGFDIRGDPYAAARIAGTEWMFNGFAGVSFTLNSAAAPVDLASAHLYSDFWGLPRGAGNDWIRDHVRLASAAGKPLILGEFGATGRPAAVYDSWLGTVLLDGGAGALVWQLSDGAADPAGLNVSCPGDGALCAVLRERGAEFARGPAGGILPPAASLSQSFPNPASSAATISYALPRGAYVRLMVYNVLGERVRTMVDAYQQAGVRKELFDARGLPGGAYYYRLEARYTETEGLTETGRILIVR